jgi:hypothetical protein
MFTLRLPSGRSPGLSTSSAPGSTPGREPGRATGSARAWAVAGLLALAATSMPCVAQLPAPAATTERASDPAPGRTVPDYGRAEYLANCAGCHGPTGRGDGHFRDFLIRPPSDLTRLSRDNQGVFPVQRALAVIDGRAEVAAHGSREMPIWGADYLAQAYTIQGGQGPVHAESYVRYRIQLLLGHLLGLQIP